MGAVTRAPLGLHPRFCQSDTKPCRAQAALQSWWYERRLVVWTSITIAFHTANLVREERSPGLDLPRGGKAEGVLGGCR